jgi:putative nucleotidyltransferase with HDIG domain
LPTEVNRCVQRALEQRRNIVNSHCFTGYLQTRTGTEAVIYVASASRLRGVDHTLIDLFFRNATIGLENLHLRQNVEETQQEIVYLLSDAVETRSNETGNHVRRVAEYARELALLSGLEPEEADLLRAAAPLHDVGKIGVPDAVLNKPGELDEDEWGIMKTHTTQGARILESSKRPLLRAAALVAEQHHENWNGSGYPRGLAGKEIHLYGRIVALADVFDALASDRCYKNAWELNRVIDHLRRERGEKFDPELVDLFLDNLHRFTEIRKRFPD